MLMEGENQKELRIYFDDLNEEAQEEYLRFYGVKSPEELNVDNLWNPICILLNEVEEENG